MGCFFVFYLQLCVQNTTMDIGAFLLSCEVLLFSISSGIQFMKKLFFFCSILLICLASIQAETPSKSYEMGFKTISVFDYKQALKKASEDIPRFPPRTGNAVIVDFVEYDSRAEKAGLQDQDLILLVNGKLLKSPEEGDKILKKITYKDELKLRVIRREGNKWKRINVTLEPMSDLNYFRTLLYRGLRYDYEFDLKYYVSYRKNSLSTFSFKNFQIYYTKNSGKPPETLYLKLSMLLPGTNSFLNESTLAGFIVKTDSAKYRIVEVDKTWEQEKAFKKELAEAKKLIQAERIKLAEAKKKNKANGELTKIVKEFDLAKEKYLKIQKAQSDFSKLVSKFNEQREERLRKKFSDIYFDLPEYITIMRDELIQKVTNLEADIPEVTLQTLEMRGLGKRYIEVARGMQGWKFYDEPLKKEQMKMIYDIISSHKVTIYFENAPDKQFELTPEQKEGLKVVLKVFQADGGKVTD